MGMFCTINFGKIKRLIISLAVALGVGALSGFLTSGSMEIYKMLEKPPLSPPPFVFPIVWGILFTLMGIAAYRVAKCGIAGHAVKEAIFYYAIQLIVNFVWPILFFNLQLYGVAFFWCLLLAILIAVTIAKFRRVDKAAGYLMLPYLAWVIFAAYLNLGIWILN